MKFHNFTDYPSLMVTDREEKIKQYVLHLQKESSLYAEKRRLVRFLSNLPLGQMS